MAKYVSKPNYIDAVLFEAGMHDGYACYDNISGEFIGFYSKDRYPKVMKREYAIKVVDEGDVEWQIVKEGKHAIVTYKSGYRTSMSLQYLDLFYERVED